MAGSPSYFHADGAPGAAKTVNITVLEGHDLKGVKGDGPVTFVRAEFSGIVLGDSPKVDASPEGNAKYNFTTSFDCSQEGQYSLDDVAHKPVLFTVTEVLPKEKKQKEEKTVMLGQAVLDLLPLLQGLSTFNATLPLHPVPNSPLDSSRPDAKCALDVLVSTPDSLLSPYQLSDGNLLRVTMEAAFSVPEAFVPTGPQQNYMVGFQVPALGEKECPFLFKNGILKFGGEREPFPRPKRWPVTNIVALGAQNIPDAFIVGGAYEEEDGELNTIEERDFRIQGETVKKRIVWDFERRCYLDPAAVLCFRKRIADSRYLPVEITRVPVATTTKGKGGKGEKGGAGGEEDQISFHGVAFVNLVPLLYPGVKQIRGAFRIFPYLDSEVFEKTKCLFSLFRDVGHQAALGKFGPGGLCPPQIKGILGKNVKDDKSVKEVIMRKVSTVVRRETSEITVETAVSMCQNIDGQQYVESGAFLVMEFALDKPLVPKRLPEELASRLSCDVDHGATFNKFGPGGLYLQQVKSILGENPKDVELMNRKKAVPSSFIDGRIPGHPKDVPFFETQKDHPFVQEILVSQYNLHPESVSHCPNVQPAGDFKTTTAKRVREIIPPRPQLPRRTTGAKKAVEDYHTQIRSIAGSILDEYQELFGRQLAEGLAVDSHTLEDQKCQLNYELNSSGKYFAFKEQLKHAVVKIVREKYLKTTAFDNLDQLQAFLSELYVYLVDQMHVALNEVLTQQSPSPPPPTFTTSEQLRLFAREAQVNGDLDLASTYYQERLSRDRQDIQSWLDYGAFCLLIEDNLKAQECFREAVALDSAHLQSILLCGIMAVMLENYEDAEVFFDDATCLDPSSVIAWTMLGLFYDIQENDIRVEMAFREANKLQKARLPKEKLPLEITEGSGRSPFASRAPSFSGSKEELFSDEIPDTSLKQRADSLEPPITLRLPEEETMRKMSKRLSIASSKLKVPVQKEAAKPPLVVAFEAEPYLPPPAPRIPTIFMETINFLIEVNALQFVHRALAHELLCPQGGPSCEYYLVLAQTYLLKNEFEKAEESLEQAIQIDYLNPDVWAQKGHLCYLTGNLSEAKACYERTVSFVTDAKEMRFVYLRLGSIYLEGKEYDKAKTIYLLACKKSPSCLTWLGVGIACYRLKEMAEAEDALSEANSLNNNNAEVWAYLALVCMQGGRQLEAEQSYKYAVKLELSNQSLLQEIKEVQLEVGFGDPSF